VENLFAALFKILMTGGVKYVHFKSQGPRLKELQLTLRRHAIGRTGRETYIRLIALEALDNVVERALRRRDG
jgi:hypothetical protein